MSDKVFDRQGREISYEQWAQIRKQGGIDAIRVARDKVGVSGDQVEVSTVWLGLDHSYGSGPPLIFETLVMGGSLDQEMDRYSTEAEAIAGHKAMCDRVRAS